MKTKTNVNDVIVSMLGERLKQYSGEQLSRSTCYSIYNTIFGTLTDVIQQSGIKITNEAMNYLAQTYYDCVSINDRNEQLDPNIFTQRATIDNVPTHEALLLAGLLRGTGFDAEILLKIKQRS